MANYRLRLTEPRPFFAELPYYLWGEVSYDSEGDCKSPTDQSWTWLDLMNRETREHLPRWTLQIRPPVDSKNRPPRA
jgi:hypothetical protein